MPKVDPYRSWRIRITGEHSHQWEVEENGEWTVVPQSALPIRIARESAGYVFYDQAWVAGVGLGPQTEDITLEAQPSEPPEINPFGDGETPRFAPDSTFSGTESGGTETEYAWRIVGAESAFPDGFPRTTDGRTWHFDIKTPEAVIDPEMVILSPNDPPPDDESRD